MRWPAVLKECNPPRTQYSHGWSRSVDSTVPPLGLVRFSPLWTLFEFSFAFPEWIIGDPYRGRVERTGRPYSPSRLHAGGAGKQPILADEPGGNKAPVVLLQRFETRRKHDVKAESARVSHHFGAEFRDGGAGLDFGTRPFPPKLTLCGTRWYPRPGAYCLKEHCATSRDSSNLTYGSQRILAAHRRAAIPSREESLPYCEPARQAECL